MNTSFCRFLIHNFYSQQTYRRGIHKNVLHYPFLFKIKNFDHTLLAWNARQYRIKTNDIHDEMLVNSGSMSLKKRTRGRRPMNGNASTGEPPGKKASHEVKADEASFKIYRLLQV